MAIPNQIIANMRSLSISGLQKPVAFLLAAIPLAAVLLTLSFTASAQYMEKVSFDAGDSTNGYYLAIPPASNSIKGVVVLFCNFRSPENLLPETKLHNVAAASGLLTIYASLGKALVANPATISRIQAVLQHVIAKYGADTSTFVLGGYDLAGSIILRYTELAYEHPSGYAVHPKVVFGINPTVDLSGLYHWCERQIKKNYFPPVVNDGITIKGLMDKEPGALNEHPDQYRELSPFNSAGETPGNEQFLRHVAVRLYYDTDIGWQLKTRRNGYYDTNLPDGAEMINRLLLEGNNKAEFVSSKLPGMRSNGIRNASALSIMDETDCIQWIKAELHILDPNNPMAWAAPYRFIIPDGWRAERAYIPGPFSTHVTIRGIEDIRFPAGWPDAKSEEYWSVAYLLWLDGGQKIDGNVLQSNLKLYYDDLVPGALARRNISMPADKVPLARVMLKKTTPEPDDLETYTGTIDMLDYMAQRPMTLNCLVHVKSCSVQGHIPVFFEISPKPFDHPIWHVLRSMKEKFACEE